MSVGAKWALRYAIVTFVTISLLGFYVYDRVEGRIRRDAELIAEIPLRNVGDVERRFPGDVERIEAAIRDEVSASDSDLRLGIQFFDVDGRLRAADGSLRHHELPLLERVRSGEDDSHFWVVDLGEGHPYYVVSQRAQRGFIQTAIYSRRFERHADFIADGFLLALPITLILTVGLGWLLARGSLRPIQRMTASARRISGAHLDEEVPTTGSGDELDQLAVTLNDMIGRIRTSMERTRQFSGDAAHELRTPLAAIRSQIEVTLEKDRGDDEYQRVLRHILEEIGRLAEGTDAMLRLSRSEAGVEPGRRVDVDLAALLTDVVEFFAPLAEEEGVKLELRAADTPHVAGDPAWLHQLFANLVHNALKFTSAGGSVGVELVRGPATAVVRVRDTGVGMEPEELERIFERFHKVDASRTEGGFGLGLALAREIAQAHAGRVRVESEPGRGSCFEVELPLGDAAGA